MQLKSCLSCPNYVLNLISNKKCFYDPLDSFVFLFSDCLQHLHNYTHRYGYCFSIFLYMVIYQQNKHNFKRQDYCLIRTLLLFSSIFLSILSFSKFINSNILSYFYYDILFCGFCYNIKAPFKRKKLMLYILLAINIKDY